MNGMVNLAGILLGGEGIKSVAAVQTQQLFANQKRFEKAATTYFYSLFQRFDYTGDLKDSFTSLGYPLTAPTSRCFGFD